MKPKAIITRLLEGVRSLKAAQPEDSGADPSPDECRISPRIVCRYRVQMVASDQEFTASVVDIGTAGLRVEDVPELQPGTVYEISYPYAGSRKHRAPLKVEVMWCRADSKRPQVRVAGCRFCERGSDLKGTWVYPLLSELGLTGDAVFQKRKHLRLNSGQKVFLRDSRTHRHLVEGRVNNISVGGALVQSAFALEAGRRVRAVIGPSPEAALLTIEAEVAGCRKDPEEGYRLISLRFVELKADQLQALESLILKMLTEQ